MGQILTWIKSYPRFMNAISSFIDEIGINVNNAPKNQSDLTDAIEALKKLDIIGALRSFCKAVGFDEEKSKKFITIIEEDAVIVDRIIKEVLKFLTDHLDYVFTNVIMILNNLEKGLLIPSILNILTMIPTNIEGLYSLILEVEKANKTGIKESALGALDVEKLMKKYMPLKNLPEILDRKQIEEGMTLLIDVVGLKSEELGKIMEDVQTVMQMIEEEMVPQKLEEYLGPCIPNEETFMNAVQGLIGRVKPTSNPDLWMFFGKKIAAKFRYDQAIVCFKKAIEIAQEEDPKDEMYYELALANIHSNLWEDAKIACDKAIELKGGMGHYWGLRAVALLGASKEQDAKRDWEKALELSPDHLPMLMLWADAFYLSKKFDKAIELYNQILEKVPNSWTLMHLGFVYLWKNDYENAKVTFEKSFDLLDFKIPTHKLFYFLNSGCLSLAKGLNQRAIFEFTKFIDVIRGTDAERALYLAFNLRAIAYDKMKKKEMAREDVQKAFAIYPKSLWVKESLEKIGTKSADEEEEETD
ncbi:hypothetical protein M0813_17890 [Anaeramoeba flamelloides]|uniref:Tetratricopeptide repeat protein n=1 Tax=Anaeramoeba flamelloides TaxID=1746091 RepID=A0ABQ8YUD5_9EUKA|nr:hypothetical protein M0813_17890 [Anaeramoeba flamelloides]